MDTIPDGGMDGGTPRPADEKELLDELEFLEDLEQMREWEWLQEL